MKKFMANHIQQIVEGSGIMFRDLFENTIENLTVSWYRRGVERCHRSAFEESRRKPTGCLQGPLSNGLRYFHCNHKIGKTILREERKRSVFDSRWVHKFFSFSKITYHIQQNVETDEKSSR